MKNKIKGFTFVELLVALSVFAILTTSICYTLTSGMKVWFSGNSIIEKNQRLRVFLETVSTDLGNAVIYQPVKTEWAKDKISFPLITGYYANGRMNGQLAKAEYSFDSEKGTLVRTLGILVNAFAEGKTSEEKNEMALLDNLEEFSFEYAYASSKEGEKIIWKNEWPDEDKLPRGVRMKFVFKTEDGSKKEVFIKTVLLPLGEIGKEE